MENKKTLRNLKDKKEFRMLLRNNATSAERELWKYLQKKQLEGRRFRRQYSIGAFILDFYCPEESLAIELDGAAHFTKEGMKYDKMRERIINKQGIRLIRFENKLIFENLDFVLDEIRKSLKEK